MTNAHSLTLYVDQQQLSPYGMWAYIALTEKNVPFELSKVELGKGTRSPEYQALSLTSRVPTLVDGAFTLAESSAIIEYLEEVFPAPTYARVLPADVQQRARARQIQAWLRSDLMALREERSTAVLFGKRNSAALSADGKRAAENLVRVADALLPAGERELFGSWCIADTELALTLNRLLANGDGLPAKLQTYVEHQWARPSVQQWLSSRPERLSVF